MKQNQMLAALAATPLLLLGWGGTALAQTCPVGAEMPPIVGGPDGALFAIEGPLVSFDRTARTIRVFDSTMEVPADLLVSTGHGKFITFDELTDPTLEQTRTVIGGTIKGGGTTVDTNGDGCMELVMNDFVFEFSEDVMVGNITGDALDLTNETVWVLGVPVKMNDDPRLPAAIVDINGQDGLALSDLQGFEGTVLGVEGYLEGDTLRAIVLETEAYIESATTDNVAITRAQHEPDDNELQVRGSISPLGATHVDIYAPGVVNAAGTACDGTFVSQAGLIAGDVPDTAEYDFRWSSAPSTTLSSVCVMSSGGGVAQREVSVK